MAVAVLLVVVSALILVACLQHARSQGWKAPGLPALQRVRQLPSTPADDLPPVGLTPLIPTPRAMASEYERGLRDLTLFLATQSRD